MSLLLFLLMLMLMPLLVPMPMLLMLLLLCGGEWPRRAWWWPRSQCLSGYDGGGRDVRRQTYGRRIATVTGGNGVCVVAAAATLDDAVTCSVLEKKPLLVLGQLDVFTPEEQLLLPSYHYVLDRHRGSGLFGPRWQRIVPIYCHRSFVVLVCERTAGLVKGGEQSEQSLRTASCSLMDLFVC